MLMFRSRRRRYLWGLPALIVFSTLSGRCKWRGGGSSRIGSKQNRSEAAKVSYDKADPPDNASELPGLPPAGEKPVAATVMTSFDLMPGAKGVTKRGIMQSFLPCLARATCSS